MPRKTILTTFLFFATLTLQLRAQAQFYTGPIATAMGGAGRAIGSPSESAYLNPASLVLLRSYYAAAAMDWGDHPNDGSRNEFSALLADGTPGESFPGQFSYVQRRDSTPNGFGANLQDFQLGVGYAPSDVLGIGLSAHRLLYLDNTSHAYTQNNVSFGTIIAPMKELAFGFVAYDMLGGDDSVPQAYQTVPTWAFASSYRYGANFVACLDVVRPDKFNEGHRMNTQLGLQTYFRPDFAVRAGWQWREVGSEEKLISFGAGYKGPRAVGQAL